MSRFRLIAAGVDVSKVNAELDAQPELWSTHGYRTQAGSVHEGVPDVWVRWRAQEELRTSADYRDPHVSVFWPAWRALPALHPIVYNLSAAMRSVQMGGILITRVPPGGEVKPHIDRGWHAEFYDTKLYLVLKANPLCLNYCDGEVEHFREGDVWEFPNSVPHSVGPNNGTTDRVTVIICLRTES